MMEERLKEQTLRGNPPRDEVLASKRQVTLQVGNTSVNWKEVNRFISYPLCHYFTCLLTFITKKAIVVLIVMSYHKQYPEMF